MTDQDRITKAAARFPKTFGLRAFPSDKFTINERQSYVSGGEVMLYVYTVDTMQAFAKGTPEELLREVR